MGIVFTDYLKFLMPLLIVAPGLLAPQMFPKLEKPDLVFPTLVQHLLPRGLVGLVMAGLIAAVMSHISGAINSAITIVTMDFYLPYIRPRATEAQAVRFGRLSGVVFVLLGMLYDLLIMYSQRPVFSYLLDAYGYLTPGIATMFLMGILWKRTTHAGALTAGILGIPLSVFLQLIFPGLAYFNRAGIVFWVCLAVCALVSLFTKPKSDAELVGLIWNKKSLMLPLDQRRLYHGVRSPFLWWTLITAVVLLFYVCFF